MKLLVLQLQKDWRRLWPWVLAWVAIVAARLDEVLEAHALPQPVQFAYALTDYRDLVAVAVTALLVQQDPPLGRDAFWMTRPIRPGVLLSSKLIFVVLFVLAPVLFAQLIALVSIGLQGEELIEGMFQALLWQSALVLLAGTLAALTTTLTRFTIVAAGLALAVAFLRRVLLEPFGLIPELGTGAAVASGAAVMGVVIGLVFLTAAVGAAYRMRRAPAAAAIFLVGALAIHPAATMLAAGGGERSSESAGPALGGELTTTLEPIPPLLRWTSRPGTDRIFFGARLRLSGLSENVSIVIEDFRARLRFADGTEFNGTGDGFRWWPAETMKEADVLGGTARRRQPLNIDIPNLLVLDRAAAERHLDQLGELTVELTLGGRQTVVRSRLPLAVDAQSRDGRRRLRITGITQKDAELEISLVHQSLLPFTPSYSVVESSPGSVILNPVRREALSRHSTLGWSSRITGLVVEVPRIEYREYRYGWLTSARDTPESSAGAYRLVRLPVAEDWLPEARLLLVDDLALGPIEQRVVLSEVKLLGWICPSSFVRARESNQ